MSDNKILKDRLDVAKVNSQEPYDVEDLRQKYSHLSHQTISDAVKKHGPDRKKIETYLDGFWKDK